MGRQTVPAAERGQSHPHRGSAGGNGSFRIPGGACTLRFSRDSPDRGRNGSFCGRTGSHRRVIPVDLMSLLSGQESGGGSLPGLPHPSGIFLCTVFRIADLAESAAPMQAFPGNVPFLPGQGLPGAFPEMTGQGGPKITGSAPRGQRPGEGKRPASADRIPSLRALTAPGFPAAVWAGKSLMPASFPAFHPAATGHE